MHQKESGRFFKHLACLLISAPVAVFLLSCSQTPANSVDAHALEESEDGHQHEADEGKHQEGEAAVSTNVSGASEDWEKLIGLKTAPALYRPINVTLPAPAQIVPNENRMAIISPFIASSVNSVLVNIGDKVKKGDVLICLTSPEIGVLRAEYEKASAALEISEKNLERRRNLFQREILSEKSLQEAQLERQLAEASRRFALKKMTALGIELEEIDHSMGHDDDAGSSLHIHSPISGTITFRNARVGQKVDTSTRLFEIMNLENVWLDADIFERELVSVKLGQQILLRVPAYPEKIFSGKIFYIGDTVAQETKTLCLRAQIDNKPGLLKPGMFAEASIVIGEKEKALVVPKEAILTDENEKIVFVVEVGGYHRHVVTTGLETDDFVEITSGLPPDAVVVTTGHYQLLSKVDKSAPDPHAGHVH